MVFAALKRSAASSKPAALYSRCRAAKPRNCSCVGKAHLARRNRRETKPKSWTVRGEAEYGAITWFWCLGGQYRSEKGLNPM